MRVPQVQAGELMPVSIQIKGLDAVVDKLGAIAARDALKPAMNRSLARLQDGLTKYPTKGVEPGGGWVSRMTPRARGWFFAALREGRITIPYQRTMKLGQSWTTKLEHSGGKFGLRGIIGNVRQYGPLVQDEATQAAIHKGRWPTIQSVAKDQRDRLVKDFAEEIERLLK